jgi:hypothetical protein
MKAQDFITSLPEGLFTHFKVWKLALYYKLDFALIKTNRTIWF